MPESRTGPVPWSSSVLIGLGVSVILILPDQATPVARFLIGCVGATLLVASVAGIRAASIVMLLFLTAPGVIGEGEGRYSLVFLAVATFFAITEKSSRSVGPLFLIAVAPLFVFLGIVWALPESRAWSLVFLMTAAFCCVMLTRPELSRRVLIGVSALVSIVSILYIGSLLSGALDRQVGVLLGVRTVFESAPWVYTQSGTRFASVNEPRMLIGVGEPGLNIFLLASAFVGATLIKHRLGRPATFSLVAAGTLFSQSQGVLLSMIGGGVAYFIIDNVAKGKTARTMVAALLGIPLLAYSALRALSIRSEGSASATLTDRGLGSGGSVQAPNQTAINILKAVSFHPELAVFTIAALLLLFAACYCDALSVFYVTCLAITSVFTQPIWGAPAAWALVAVVASAQMALLGRPMPIARRARACEVKTANHSGSS